MSKPLIPISGRTVAITGGARGLGLATAKELASRGARVAIGDLDGDGAGELLIGGPGISSGGGVYVEGSEP